MLGLTVNKYQQMWNMLRHRIRTRLGMKYKYELEREAEQEKKYIADGFPDPKEYQMFACFSYNDDKKELVQERFNLNPRTYGVDGRSRDLELQNEEWFKTFLTKIGFVHEDEKDGFFFVNDWWRRNHFQLKEVLTREEALNFLENFLHKFYPDGYTVKSEEADPSYNDGATGLWIVVYFKAKPLLDRGKRFGFYERETGFWFGLEKEVLDARINLGWGFGVIWYRYGVPQYNSKVKELDIYREIGDVDRFNPSLPNYVPQELAKLPYKDFVWEVGGLKVHMTWEYERVKPWAITGVKGFDHPLTFGTRLEAIEWAYSYSKKKEKVK